MNFVQNETIAPLKEIPQIAAAEPNFPLVVQPSPPGTKNAIRTSLRASTLDGVFATIFSNVAGGVLLSNFLVELDATPIQIGMLSSIPMVVNLIQPLGAYISDRTKSRHRYCLWIYGISRILWLILVLGIGITSWGNTEPRQLVQWTLSVVLVSHILGALGSAPWFSWLATLVPRRLRGRYFGIRNSAASLTNLACLPLMGLIVSTWPGGSLQGYGAVLSLGIVAGLISLMFQYFMVDVNPQIQKSLACNPTQSANNDDLDPETTKYLPKTQLNSQSSILKNSNFLMFLLYFSLWMFAVNLSAPFFNLYMLDTLALDVRWVTLYSSLNAGTHLLMMMLWGKVADRIGNRAILISVGILVALTPLLWLGTDTNSISIWLWLPLLHLLSGGIWAAIDLCNNNMQIAIAPLENQSLYFALTAAIAGVSGALGTTAGGFLAQLADYGGLPGLFALSSVVRLAALLPLILVREQRGKSLREMMRAFLLVKVRLKMNEIF
ncbi:MFS transporter [Lyngbya aestuarii]|uniref:MFS transporter n=1 Tax=Lyngbya aestuarii TaxID=118322 RepID=UPI00403DC0A4